MKIKKVLLMMSIIASLGMYSCGDKDEETAAIACSESYSEFLSDDFQAYTDALTALSEDPTSTAKCETFKAAAENLIEKYIEAYKDCGLENYDEVKDAWEASLSSFSC